MMEQTRHSGAASTGRPEQSDVLPGLLANTLGTLGAVFAGSVLVYLVAGSLFSLGADVIAAAAVLLFVIFVLVVTGLPAHGQSRFGPANLVTSLRAAIVCLVSGTLLFADGLGDTPSIVWSMAALVVVALALDGVDGYLARRYGHESVLGARFDMEVDALLILVLSCAGLILGKAGWWILLVGLMRYVFVAAQQLVPRLRADLPPSFRRKLVCVIQVAALCIVLMPIVVPPLSGIVAAVALALLAYSFAVDVHDLLTREASAE